MRVIGLEYLTDDTGALAIAAGGAKTHVVHRVEDAPLDWFEPVADIGKRALDDDAHRIIEIGATHFRVNIDLSDVACLHGLGLPDYTYVRDAITRQLYHFRRFSAETGGCARVA